MSDRADPSLHRRRPIRRARPVVVGAVALIGAAAAVATACSPPPLPAPPVIPPPAPLIGATTQVLPGPGIPTDAPLGQANNNLDVVEAGGSRYLAIRTSWIHFASPFTRVVVFRSDDGGTNWVTETVIDRGRDLREPRFLEIDGSLFLYFFEAGTNPFAFQPGRVFATRRSLGAGGSLAGWSDPVAVSPEDAVVWRTKWLGDRPVMVRYRGGGDSYSSGEAAIEVELLTTDDGFDWRPLDPARPVVHTGGAGETDVAFDGDGRLWAVMRNEAGERGRFGSLVCSGRPDDVTAWTCVDDPRKFDSPLLFGHGGDIWLLARRQVANDGRYDLGLRAPRDAQLLAYQAAYWVTPKRLALWKLDTERGVVDWVADLPSRGDTAFPGIVWTGPDSIDVYNYSSPLPADRSAGSDLPWVVGQLGPTNIYVTPITFPPAR